MLIGVNGFTCIRAVNNVYVVDTSLGDSINPLMNMLPDFLFLRECLTRLQGRAIALVCIGVLWSVIGHGAFPWLALGLAVSLAACSHLTRKARFSV